MKQYKAEVERYETDRQELANAEKLFDLPITMYPQLLQVQKDMKGMEQIYAIYEEQLVGSFNVIFWWSPKLGLRLPSFAEHNYVSMETINE